MHRYEVTNILIVGIVQPSSVYPLLGFFINLCLINSIRLSKFTRAVRFLWRKKSKVLFFCFLILFYFVLNMIINVVKILVYFFIDHLLLNRFWIFFS